MHTQMNRGPCLKSKKVEPSHTYMEEVTNKHCYKYKTPIHLVLVVVMCVLTYNDQSYTPNKKVWWVL